MIPLKDQEILRQKFEAELAGQVKIDFFTQRELSIFVPGRQECQYCKPTQDMLKELAALSDKLSLRTHLIEEEREEARKYGVTRIPAIVLRGKSGRPLIFFGFPAGTEFPSFIESIIDVSTATSLLSAESKKKLAELKSDVRLQVFVTPTCPHCPRMARLAYHLALESEHIRAEVTEIGEFPDLAERYQVRAVPLTIISTDGIDKIALPGAVLEQVLIEQVLKAAGVSVAIADDIRGESSPASVPPSQEQAGQRRSGGLIIP
ncbi:MAG TPA: thioredoxin family protein [Dehalococcoidia bacterium]|nr:thioredoxin family protein [Dehalococcoidia bacterium]